MPKARLSRPRKAQLPRGFSDRVGAAWRREHQLVARLLPLYEAHGFVPLETPALEYSDLLGQFLPDAERPNQAVFSLQDDDEQWLSLRYDLTAPFARYVAMAYEGLPKPFRRYQYGSVWRNEKPGPGRLREFTQLDADIADSGEVARTPNCACWPAKPCSGWTRRSIGCASIIAACWMACWRNWAGTTATRIMRRAA